MGVSRCLICIAWRNVFRNRRRTALTLAVLSLGSAGLILIGGFFDNILEGLREQLIHSQTGHLQVSALDFSRKGVTDPYEFLLKDASKIRAEIEEDPRVRFTVPRLQVSAMASSDRASVAVTVLGSDAEKDERMGAAKARNSDRPAVSIEEGRGLSADDPYGAVLGKGLLSALGLKIGDVVTVLTTHRGGAIDSAQYVIRGTFTTIMKEIDDHVMKVNLGTAQKLMGADGAVHSLLAVLNETSGTEPVRALLSERFRANGRNLEIRSWNEVQLYYEQSRSMFRRIYTVLQIILCAVFVFSIANTVNMGLLERIREFGTMMAIGNKRTTVFGVILLEVLFLGLLGASAGVLVGSGAAQAVSMMGIEMPPPPSSSNPYFAMINLSSGLLAATFGIALLSTILSGLGPAYRAVHIRIVEALGYL